MHKHNVNSYNLSFFLIMECDPWHEAHLWTEFFDSGRIGTSQNGVQIPPFPKEKILLSKNFTETKLLHIKSVN